jgi:serine O-acetyltransferase
MTPALAGALALKRVAARAQTANAHWTAIARDIQRYRDLDDDAGDGPPAAGIRAWLSTAWLCATTPGLHSTLIFRFGHWVYGSPAVRAWLPLRVMYRLLDLACSLVWRVHIDVRARIGGGLYIGHADGILIGPVTMGVDCTVGRHVTIGRRANARADVPVIGDRAYIGIGSVIFGGIRIGDGVTIGPLTVVGRSLPDSVLVSGSPVKLLRRRYDNSLEVYGRRSVVAAADGVR